MERKIYEFVSWANKTTQPDINKKIELVAVDMDAAIVFSTSAADNKADWTEIARIPIKKSQFTEVGRTIFSRSARLIQSQTFKQKDITADTVICDVAFTSSDIHILRLTSMVKVFDGKPQRVTKVTVHKFSSWEEKNNEGKNRKGNVLGYGKESIVFDMNIGTFPVTENTFYSRDVILFEDFGRKFDVMFDNSYSYGKFLESAFDEMSNKQQTAPNPAPASTPTETETTSTADGEFPW